MEGGSELEELVRSLTTRADPAELLRDFVPPSRFGEKRFENYHPRHPTQAAAMDRLQETAARLHAPVRRPGFATRLFGAARPAAGAGVYLDGGFGVGKTHLLAAFWHAAPAPRAYLSFDQLMHYIGLVGAAAAGEGFASFRVIAVDEWELDDPGNLKMALAFLRRVLGGGSFVAVTSNTLPLELGAGRFSQKDFRAEVEELAGAFEVVRVEGDDYRHRRFERNPGRGYFLDPTALEARAADAAAGGGPLQASFPALLAALNRVHPIRYRDLTRRVDALVVHDVTPIPGLADSLRWVHFIDAVYDAGVRLIASGTCALADIFPPHALEGPYGKKLSRCLSRMEELLGDEMRGGGEN